MSQAAYELQSSIDTLITLTAELESDLLAASDSAISVNARTRRRTWSAKVNALRSLAHDVRRLTRSRREASTGDTVAGLQDTTGDAVASLQDAIGALNELDACHRRALDCPFVEGRNRLRSHVASASACGGAAAKHVQKALSRLGKRRANGGCPEAVARVREATRALSRNADATLLAMSSVYLTLGHVGDLVEHPEGRDKVRALAETEARRADARLRVADAERRAAMEHLGSALLHLGERAE